LRGRALISGTETPFEPKRVNLVEQKDELRQTAMIEGE
jgi:hypothetical protein